MTDINVVFFKLEYMFFWKLTASCLTSAWVPSSKVTVFFVSNQQCLSTRIWCHIPENHDLNIHFHQNVTHFLVLVMHIVSRRRLWELTYYVVMPEEITPHRSDIDKNCDPGTKSEGEEDSQSKVKATLGRTPNHLSLSTTSTLSAGSTGSQARLIQSSHQPENYQPTTVKDLGKPTCMQCYLSGKYMPKW